MRTTLLAMLPQFLLLILGARCAAAPATNPSAIRIGTIAADQIDEASGVIASRKYPGVYWTHNDGGDGVLYAIRRDGSLIGQAKLDVKVHDWEDIAIDDAGNLYVSDMGNNDEERKHVFVHRFAEPDPNHLDQIKKLKMSMTWRLTYPGKPFNCESLFVWNNFGYVISKRQGSAKVYRFSLNENPRQVLEKLFTLPIEPPVTAADITADGSQLAVLARGEIYFFTINGDIPKAASVEPTHITFPPVKSEGCALTDDGVIIVAESREIYFVPRP